MKYIERLGKQLKDPLIIDVLECADLDVIYGFDRLNENQPDEYWVSAHEDGVEMHFDAHQLLNTIFFYLEPDGDFRSCAPDTIGLPTFDSRQAVREYADSSNLRYDQGETDFLGIHREWVKVNHGTHLHHLEFRESRLHKRQPCSPNRQNKIR
ncbi:MAG: hypothetical protein ACSHX0_13140 [Akkermansiaceae bacterium]